MALQLLLLNSTECAAMVIMYVLETLTRASFMWAVSPAQPSNGWQPQALQIKLASQEQPCIKEPLMAADLVQG